MRILVAATPGVGHLLPLLPVARAATARGHEVRIATGAGLAPVVKAAGFAFERAGPDSIDEVRRSIPGVMELSGRRRAALVYRAAFCGPLAAGMADDLRALAGVWRPDVIVREDMTFGAWLAAAAVGIPNVTIQAVAWRPNLRELASEPLGVLRQRHGLPPDPDLVSLPGHTYFVTRPPSLRDPDAPFPPGSRELRPVADDHHGAGSRAPADTADPFPTRDGRPRVAVTLGTMNAHEIGLLRILIEGTVAAGAQVVVAVGAEPSTLGEVPDGVVVRAYVPMSTLVSAADIVAFHGGSGTMLTALAAGRPAIIVPLAADQPDNADRCAAAGVAIVLESRSVTADAVREAVDAIARDPAFQRRAEAVAREIAAMPDPDSVIDHLERILAGGEGAREEERTA